MAIEPKSPTVKGPAQWFTGDVWIDPIVRPRDASPTRLPAVKSRVIETYGSHPASS